jgi:hypothetical protein
MILNFVIELWTIIKEVRMTLTDIFRKAVALTAVSSSIYFAGCTRPCSGTGQIPDSWKQIGLSIPEGGNVCFYTEADQAEVYHGGKELPDTIDMYREQLKAAGWQVDEVKRSSMSFTAQKGLERADLQFVECNKYLGNPSTWSKCTSASIKRFDPAKK